MSEQTQIPPYRSALAEHPDVRDVLPIFIGRLGTRVRDLRSLHAAGNREELRRLAHQLKGAGKSYGFAPITEHALELEELIEAGTKEGEIVGALNKLVAYIEKIEGYTPA